VLLSTAYLPSIAWCSAFWNAENVVLEAHEHYQKGSIRNRAHIAGPNGIQLLSIPLLKGKHQQTPIQEVRIANHEPWQRQHWRTIKTAYGNAPYFEHYADGLEGFYTRQYEFLFEFNLALIEFVLVKKLGWKGALGVSVTFNTESLNEASQAPSGLNLCSNAEEHCTRSIGTASSTGYPQVFQEKHDFLPNLSILDLLLCCGKRSIEILERAT